MKRFKIAKTLLLAAVLLPLSLEANPSFARQMNMDCMACHNQSLGQLTSFGRKFAASGMTMVGAEAGKSLIDGNTLELGLPSVINASVMLKARYIKTETDYSDDPLEDEIGNNRGNLQLFKVSKLFIGGKVANNVGGLVNAKDGSIGAKVTLVDHLEAENMNGYYGASMFMQDDFGPFSATEYYSTGLYAPLRFFDNRKSTNAAQATEVGHGPATGFHAYYGGESLFAMIGWFVPAGYRYEGLDVGTDMIPMGRIAYEAQVGDWIEALNGWTVMVGAYAINGTAILSAKALDGLTPSSGDPLFEIFRKAHGFDVQIEGEIAGMSTVIAVNSVLHNETSLYNRDTGYMDVATFSNEDVEYKAGENEAYSVEVQVNPWDAIGLKVAYLKYDDLYDYRYSTAPQQLEKIDKFDRKDYTMGVNYAYRQNVHFGVEYTYSNPERDDRPDVDDVFVYATVGF